jgi:hypothetical protein
MVITFRERLTMNKQGSRRFHMERFNVKKYLVLVIVKKNKKIKKEVVNEADCMIGLSSN